MLSVGLLALLLSVAACQQQQDAGIPSAPSAPQQPRQPMSAADFGTEVTQCPPGMSKLRCAWRKVTGFHFERRRRQNNLGRLPQSPEEAIAQVFVVDVSASFSDSEPRLKGLQGGIFIRLCFGVSVNLVHLAQLPAAMSIYHDNRAGKPERKFVSLFFLLETFSLF